MYIGRTKNLKKRWLEHLSVSKNTSAKHRFLIHRALNKYGSDNFDFRIIQTLNYLADAINAEIYWIAFYQTNILRYGDQFGYNLSDGGEGFGNTGMPMSDIHKQRIS